LDTISGSWEATIDLLRPEGIVLKLHASCRSTHPFVDALLDLKRDHPDLRPERIESIEIAMGQAKVRFWAGRTVPSTPLPPSSAPRIAWLPRCSRARSRRTLRDEWIDAPDMMELVERVRVGRDAEIDAGGVEQRNAAMVNITLADGSRLSTRRAWARGSSRGPLSPQEVDDKVLSMAAHSLPEEQAGELLRQLRLLPSLGRLDGLLSLMRPTAPRHT
jgi:2-methylcitrate dehydratase PrpD